MSEWITDRLPTKEDVDKDHCVWSTYDGKVVYMLYDIIKEGTPWMPMIKPEPYVAPETPKPKYRVNRDSVNPNEWVVYGGRYYHTLNKYIAIGLPTREAAERVAAIYNEVMP